MEHDGGVLGETDVGKTLAEGLPKHIVHSPGLCSTFAACIPPPRGPCVDHACLVGRWRGLQGWALRTFHPFPLRTSPASHLGAKYLASNFRLRTRRAPRLFPKFPLRTRFFFLGPVRSVASLSSRPYLLDLVAPSVIERDRLRTCTRISGREEQSAHP